MHMNKLTVLHRGIAISNWQLFGDLNHETVDQQDQQLKWFGLSSQNGKRLFGWGLMLGLKLYAVDGLQLIKLENLTLNCNYLLA